MHCIIRKFQMHLICFFCFPELLFQIVEEQRVSWMRWDVPLVGISLYCYQLATPNNSSQVKIHYDIMIWWVIIASKRFSAILSSLSDSQYGQYIFFLVAYCKLLLHMIYIYIIYTYHIYISYIRTLVNVMFSSLPCSIVDLNAIQVIHHSIYRCDA